jgi:6-pyruvoyltetrahydropterin/6-carboxytetrahydropterin synthase
MQIRKLFKYEMGHIVRNAWSRRCAHSAHGHSYQVEFTFCSDSLDNGGMVTDFGFIKKYMHPFVDSFDHAFCLWDRPEDAHLIEFFPQHFERVIITPFSSTAELQAAMFYRYGEMCLSRMPWANGEHDVQMQSVRVHETTTGWAEATQKDRQLITCDEMLNIKFSPGIIAEWPQQFLDFYQEVVLMNSYGI